MGGAPGLFVSIGVCVAVLQTRRMRRARAGGSAARTCHRSCTLRIVGVMSGTSADGIDVSVCDVTATQGPEAVAYIIQRVVSDEIAWPDDARSRIFELIKNPSKRVSLESLGRLNFDLARCFGQAVLEVLRKHQVPRSSVDAVACHGQTIFHDPPYSTHQIGDPSAITSATGITTVANFRVADVAMGGQGAPLASTFDWLLLRPAGDMWRAVQNIGGIGNVTLLPPTSAVCKTPGCACRGAQFGGCPAPLAFDTGPGNVFIDMAAHAVDPSLQYDVDGRLGRKGAVCAPLLEQMMAHEYLRRPLPKSTGRELYSKELFNAWRTAGEQAGATAEDMVATVTEYTACSIVDAYKRYLPPCAKLGDVVVAGGGVHNPLLMERIAAHVDALSPVVRSSSCPVTTHEAAVGVCSDSKESMLFALLGCTTLLGLPGNVPACTGARGEVVLGQVSPGPNYGELLGRCAAFSAR